MSEWKPIETAKMDGKQVWISGFEFNNPDLGRWVDSAEWDGVIWFNANQAEFYPPTHWMPKEDIPEPPK